MRRIQVTLLTAFLFITASVFGQSNKVLDGLANSYDYTQEAIASIAKAAENMTEAYQYLSSNGAKRFIKFSLENFEIAGQQITAAKSEVNSIVHAAKEADISEDIESILSLYEEIQNEIDLAVTASKEAINQRESSEIDQELRKASQGLESALPKMISALEKTNEVVLKMH